MRSGAELLHWEGADRVINRVDDKTRSEQKIVRIATFALARPRCRFGLGVLLAALAAAAVMTVAAGEGAQAQDFGGLFGYEKAKPKKRTTAKRAPAAQAERSEAKSDTKSRKGEKSADAAKMKGAKGAKGPFFGVVSIGDQRVSIYNSEGLVTRSVVSTGMAGHPTPKGVFTIIGRERYHHSNIYSGAPMPFMQRLTWSGVAMHLGVVPGYPASHGCIRLPGRFATELWGMTSIGERVVVSPRDVVPQEFAHALLPVPKMQPAPEPAIETGGVPPAELLTQVAASEPGPEMIGEPAAGAETKLYNPIAYAKLLKAKADADAKAAAKTVKQTFAAASAKTAEARRAVADVKAAEAAKAAAEAKAAEAGKALEGAQPDAQAAAEVAKINADAEFSSAARRLEAARAVEAVATPASFEAVQVWKQAKAAVAAAEATAREARQRVSPVSVLVSKKDQKVYIRQGLAPLLEAPATVRDPEVPLGTHLYIAAAEQPDGASLKWSVISMPVPSEKREKASDRKKRKDARGEEPAKDPEPIRRQASNAAEALERIEIPKDVSETIAELMWTGGSLIISDQPLSGETSDDGTDLVVTLRY